MKRILLALITLAMVCSCNDQVCKINGTITDPVDTVFLMDMNGALIDVSAVTDGAFALQCEINPESGVGIVLGEDYNPISLIPDSKKITISVADGTPVITGSPLSQELQEFQQWAMTTYFENMEQIMGLMDAGDTIGADAVSKEMKDTMASHCREVYMNHQSDALSVQAMGFLMEFLENEEFIELYEQSGKIIQQDPGISGYYEYLKALPESEKVLTLLENDEVVIEDGAFEDYVGAGKYTLVDFWASWCGPCKKEAPNVVAVYEKYRDKGLVVIGVPVNDSQEAMVQALKDLGIHYPQVLDPSNTAVDKYHIDGIPHIILFDPEGNIVANDIREAQIEEAVSKVLK